jgi:hypothetical protein
MMWRRYGEAEPQLREALQARREVLGPRHPHTLLTQLNMVALLANQSQPQEAVRTLQEMEPNLLDRIAQELYSTQGGAVRRRRIWPGWPAAPRTRASARQRGRRAA